jgi:2-keto-4-pentenoate hydratase/2-oxohepta-3-ene-1,7-dioic acid hydratase in catechol pathway
MCALLAAGDAALGAARDAAARAKRRLALDSVRLLRADPAPAKFLAIGLNYAGSRRGGGLETPKVPTVFNKQSTCVVGPRDAIHMPRVVLGARLRGRARLRDRRRCRHVPRARAARGDRGLPVVDDVSVRDWQMRVATWTMGKSFDTHGPIGPGSRPPTRSAIRTACACAPG